MNNARNLKQFGSIQYSLCYCCYIVFFYVCYKPHKALLILSLSVVYGIFILRIYSFLVLYVLFCSSLIPSGIIFPQTESTFICKVNIYVCDIKYILLFLFSFILFLCYFSIIFPLMELSLFLFCYFSSFSLFFPLCFTLVPFLLLKLPRLLYGLMMPSICFVLCKQKKKERGINESDHKCKTYMKVYVEKIQNNLN